MYFVGSYIFGDFTTECGIMSGMIYAMVGTDLHCDTSQGPIGHIKTIPSNSVNEQINSNRNPSTVSVVNIPS